MATPPPSSTPTLVCKECEYANEPERVYCHNCGAKLDRSVLPKEEQIRRESPDKARKRIMRMTNPGTSPLKREILAFVKTIVSALIIAAVIQAVRTPENIPSKEFDPNLRVLMLASDLSDLAESPLPRAAAFTEPELNKALSTKVQVKSSVPGVEYKRSYVNLENGSGRFVTEKTIYGFPIYIGALYRIGGSNGVLTATNTGGNIGHLPISPLLMERIAPILFGNVYDAFKREWTLLGQMQSVTVRKGRLDLVSRGKGR